MPYNQKCRAEKYPMEHRPGWKLESYTGRNRSCHSYFDIQTDFPEKSLSMKNLGNPSEDPVSGMNFR